MRAFAVAVPLSVLVYAVLTYLAVPEISDSAVWLLGTSFTAGISVLVAWTAARGFVKTGRIYLLLMGMAIVFSSSGTFVAGVMGTVSHVLSASPSLLSLTVFLAALAHLAAVLSMEREPLRQWAERQRNFSMLLAFVGAFAVIVAITWAAMWNSLQPFLAQNIGPMLVGQLVLVCGVALFVGAAVVLHRSPVAVNSDMAYWYVFSLVVYAVSMLSLSQTAPETLLNWFGRTLQSVASALLLLAVLSVRTREARTRADDAPRVPTIQGKG